MKKYAPAAIAAALIMICTAAVLAQGAGPPPQTGPYTVSIPYGDLIKQVFDLIGSVLGPAIMGLIAWGMARTNLPTAVQSFVHAMLTNQLLDKAIAYAINAVEGATAGKTLSIPVSNQVVAEALNYALAHGPSWLIDWMGGADAIRQKIIARLPLPPEASVDGSSVVSPNSVN